VDLQYDYFDEGMEQLESQLSSNLVQQFKKAQNTNPVPESVIQARNNRTSQQPTTPTNAN
jgi:hypothetical protein